MTYFLGHEEVDGLYIFASYLCYLNHVNRFMITLSYNGLAFWSVNYLLLNVSSCILKGVMITSKRFLSTHDSTYRFFKRDGGGNIQNMHKNTKQSHTRVNTVNPCLNYPRLYE